MHCEEIFETGLLHHHYANTSYPLTPHSFMQYKLRDEQEIRDLLVEDWQGVQELSLYIHVPFCQARCRFCEYVVLENPTDELTDEYVSLLLREMEMYAPLLAGKKIIGYDLGGGTPTRLSMAQLQRITETVTRLFDVKRGTAFSVETTPVIAAQEPEKIAALYNMGYRRISMGVQTVSEKLLSELGREGSRSLYEKAVANIRAAGFESLNIDLMYGFLNQTDRDFENTIRYAIGLEPDHITLYRNRYKGTKIEYEAGGVSIYKAMRQYRLAYQMLTQAGYAANVGKNTFSRTVGDYGTSDYLTHRVIEGTPYVGMGLGAQSFGRNYLAYNLGAAEKRMERYRTAIEEGRLPFQDIYRLPVEESMAKMVSVAFYFAFVDMKAFKARFGVDFRERFAREIDFVLQNGLMEIRGDRIYLTERGADQINGVIPLFYSERSQEELRSTFANRKASDKTDEELFLSSYRIEAYDRPSVATDVAAFSIGRKENGQESAMSVLLIKRGEHPFMNKWALPGGFLRRGETVEVCAIRETFEETGVKPDAILPIGIFSAPGRDPRGWIISNAYASVIGQDNAKLIASDDAIAAEQFTVDLQTDEDGLCTLTLQGSKATLVARLREVGSKFGIRAYEIVDSGELAFDHAAIIATGLSALRARANDMDLVFDFLPEEFTLTALQRVQETLLGTSLLTANFRRKVANLVEATGNTTSDSSKRPAMLFRRRG